MYLLIGYKFWVHCINQGMEWIWSACVELIELNEREEGEIGLRYDREIGRIKIFQ